MQLQAPPCHTAAVKVQSETCSHLSLKLLEARPDVKYVTDIRPDNHEEMTEKFAARYFATPKKMGAQTAEANINAGIAAARQIVGYLLRGDDTFRVNK